MVLIMAIIYATIFKCFFRKYGWNNFLVFTILPHVIITFINNIVMVKFGFYEISNDVILLIILSLFPLGLGMVIFKILLGLISYHGIQRTKVYYYINMKKIFVWCLLCCCMRLIQLFIIYTTLGMESIAASDYKSFQLGGLPSHLFLTTFPFSAMILYYGIEQKKLLYILLWGLVVFIAAMSFIKYHAILCIIYTALYFLIKKENGMRWILTFGTFVILVFVGNYIVGFALRDIYHYTLVDYAIKLWDYIGGSLINCNYSVTEYGESYNLYSWVDLFFSSMTAFPNTLLNKFFGVMLENKAFPLGFRVVSEYGSTSNVMSLYFMNLYTGSWGYFVLYLIWQGFFVEFLISRLRNKSSLVSEAFCIMFLSINVLTFFANYFELSMIWEVLIISFCMPKFFIKEKSILRIGEIS